jgi:hypothetical protein
LSLEPVEVTPFSTFILSQMNQSNAHARGKSAVKLVTSRCRQNPSVRKKVTGGKKITYPNTFSLIARSKTSGQLVCLLQQSVEKLRISNLVSLRCMSLLKQITVINACILFRLRDGISWRVGLGWGR